MNLTNTEQQHLAGVLAMNTKKAFTGVKSKRPWTTTVEIDYLDTIGDNYPVQGKTKRDFLHGYIQGAFRRTEWGNIDADKAIAYAEKLLAKA